MQDKPIINPLGQPFIELRSVDSTNNYALASARSGELQHGAAFFSHEQTAGKGQRGKSWQAEKSTNIALSILIQPAPLPISAQFQLSACMALAAHHFFSRYAGSDTRIKWPNDLYWQDRKAGGLLIENIISGKPADGNLSAVALGLTEPAFSAAEWRWSVAGFGININQTSFPTDLPNPVSLKQITGKEHAIVPLARELCNTAGHYLARLQHEGFDPIYTEYVSAIYKLNELVRLKKDSRVFVTTIKGVSHLGELLTENNGLTTTYNFGEVSWVLPEREIPNSPMV